LRSAVGDLVGANYDPSHPMWMGADPLQAVAAIGPAIYYVHAKDTRIEAAAGVDGVLDTRPSANVAERAWNYVTVGLGHDEDWWRRFCSALRTAGYDDVLSIEHEDASIPPREGVRRSIELLKRVAAG
jgi:sugar phosphate isomerase/epimerase